MRASSILLTLVLLGGACDGRTAEERLAKELGDAARRDDTAPQIKEELRRHGDASIAALAPLLTQDDARVSAAAVDVLQSIGSERAYDRVVTWALPNLIDPTGRTKGVGPGFTRLRDIGRPMLPALVRAYRPEVPHRTRLLMITLVSSVGDPAGLPLLDAALAGNDEEAWAKAAAALGAVGGPSAHPRLLAQLRAPEVLRRAGAIWGFRRLKDPAAVAPLLEVLLAPDMPIPEPSESPRSIGTTLHAEARIAIDELAGERLGGDVGAIRAWVERHAPR